MTPLTDTETWSADVKAGARVKFTARDSGITIEGVVRKIDFDQEALIADDDTGFSIYPRNYTAEVVTPAPPVIPTEPGYYVERDGANPGGIYYLNTRGEWLYAYADGGAFIMSRDYATKNLVALKVVE